MGCKACMGRWGLPLFTLAFSIGVLASTWSPNWIETVTDYSVSTNDATSTGSVIDIEYNFGPFYSRNRTCDPRNGCSEWVTSEVSNQDCNWLFNETASDSLDEKLCRHNTTWRVMAILCNLIVVVAGAMVLLACCIQGFTCGCCGGSINWIVMILYWIEVAFSIVAWSFAISTVHLLQDMPDTESTGYQWGFTVFILSGTVLGIVCATLSDWAADGSLLRCVADALKCVFCCNKD